MDDRVRPSVLIIRTWREDGSDRSFRAQIRVATDVSSGSSSTVHVADPDAALEVVRGFLHGKDVDTGRGSAGSGEDRR
ncbi:MAG TPA: hypothetical protein VLA82_05265 [Actinomycetota bacterium]|nr:hypothetical protein [Actinomycetota bacterium]